MPHAEHRLSEHFTLAELTVSQTAERAGLSNKPTPAALLNLVRLAAFLDEVRAVLRGAPLLISSGYRSFWLNTRVGGSPRSAHLRGLAADFIAPRYGDPRQVAQAVAASALPFDQLIYEGRWVHVAVPPDGQAPRRSVLTARFATGKAAQYMPGIV